MTALASPALPGGDRWFDDGLYTSVNELAHRSPGWLDTAISLWSTYGLLLLGALLLAAWWRARPAGSARAALALAAPLVVLAAFVVSTGLKALLHEQRPCQTLRTVTVETCPPLGDWSLPSNHAVLAAAVAVTLLFTDRRLAALAVPAAVAMAASRVWVGAHYPHDVVLGLVVGAVVAGALTAGARHAVAPVAERLHATRLRPLVARR
ncbi:phosphatase PAP2 family protein [Streptomyces sp. NPDC096310]|uniref:phosphatase PAP2 family protein n=1 Tax=Streptomyces sp. NPDC096310 TaxID=3366082 RepID=UPI0038146DC9